MNRKKLLARILVHQTNVRFQDLINLLEGFGFSVKAIRGSHHTLSHPLVGEVLNLQPKNGEAKPYQIRQALYLIEKYRLTLAD